jgi:hypothetical protein
VKALKVIAIFVLKPWATWSALGEKQEGLTIVHFLNKLIASCKEAVRFPFYFGGGEKNIKEKCFKSVKALKVTAILTAYLWFSL